MTKRSYKTVLLGDASVGKSSFAVRLTKGEFSDNTNSTIGAAFFTYTVHNDALDQRRSQNPDLGKLNGNLQSSQSEVENKSHSGSYGLDENFTIKFDIWDTAGQERFKSIAPIYYRGAACAIVILDVSSPPTLQHAAFWVNQIRVANNNETIIVLVANKIDLLGSTPETLQTLANAKAYAKEHSLSFVETSAKTGQNISFVFELLSLEIAKDPFRWDKTSSNAGKSGSKAVIKEASKQPNGKKTCCNIL